jgi:hypothetical protein
VEPREVNKTIGRRFGRHNRVIKGKIKKKLTEYYDQSFLKHYHLSSVACYQLCCFVTATTINQQMTHFDNFENLSTVLVLSKLTLTFVNTIQ